MCRWMTFYECTCNKNKASEIQIKPIEISVFLYIPEQISNGIKIVRFFQKHLRLYYQSCKNQGSINLKHKYVDEILSCESNNCEIGRVIISTLGVTAFRGFYKKYRHLLQLQNKTQIQENKFGLVMR